MKRWDDTDDVRWTTDISIDTAVEVISVADMRDQHLRASNGSAEDAYIGRITAAARSLGETVTNRCWLPRTLVQRGDAFPCGAGVITLAKNPVIEVVSVRYVDIAGNWQELAEGTNFVVSLSGRENKRTRVAPAYGMAWPNTRCELDAVEIIYRAGYTAPGSPETLDVPVDLVHGVLLVAGELYKQRSESVHAFNQNPALIRARDLWQRHRIY